MQRGGKACESAKHTSTCVIHGMIRLISYILHMCVMCVHMTVDGTYLEDVIYAMQLSKFRIRPSETVTWLISNIHARV